MKKLLVLILLVGLLISDAFAEEVTAFATKRLTFIPEKVSFIWNCTDKKEYIISDGLLNKVYGPNDEVLWRGISVIDNTNSCRTYNVMARFKGDKAQDHSGDIILGKSTTLDNFLNVEQISLLIPIAKNKLIELEKENQVMKAKLDEAKDRITREEGLSEVLIVRDRIDELKKAIVRLDLEIKLQEDMKVRAKSLVMPTNYESRLIENTAALDKVARAVQQLRMAQQRRY